MRRVEITDAMVERLARHQRHDWGLLSEFWRNQARERARELLDVALNGDSQPCCKPSSDDVQALTDWLRRDSLDWDEVNRND